jgi:glucose-1-phosphate cytidylyltransferase
VFEGRFGALNINNENRIKEFEEKPKGDGNWINAGFFVCESKVFDYIDSSENVMFEQEPLQNLAKDGQLYAYKHNGFWRSMDSLKDKSDLNQLWDDGEPPWKIW